MFNKFWQKIGLGKSGKWQKIKWIIVSFIFFIPNLMFYFICRIGQYTEKLWFENYMPKMWRWIKS